LRCRTGGGFDGAVSAAASTSVVVDESGEGAILETASLGLPFVAAALWE